MAGGTLEETRSAISRWRVSRRAFPTSACVDLYRYEMEPSIPHLDAVCCVRLLLLDSSGWPELVPVPGRADDTPRELGDDLPPSAASALHAPATRCQRAAALAPLPSRRCQRVAEPRRLTTTACQVQPVLRPQRRFCIFMSRGSGVPKYQKDGTRQGSGAGVLERGRRDPGKGNALTSES